MRHHFLIFLGFLACSVQALEYSPVRIHLSAGFDQNSWGITWSTTDDTGENWAEVCPNDNSTDDCQRFDAKTFPLECGQLVRKICQYTHKALATNLVRNHQYKYRVANSQKMSDWITFQTFPEGENWSPRFAVYGDLGLVNGRSIPRLNNDTEQGLYDAVLHVGDFAYNLDWDEGKVGDKFLQEIQPMASRVPYMTCPGNHEIRHNFSDYQNRFYMPGDTSNQWYSWNIGPAHIISISSEFYGYLPLGLLGDRIERQYDWLVADLKQANQDRATRPWLIVMMHRPFYCDDNSIWNCKLISNFLRKGVDGKYQLEKLFHENGVDLMFVGHMHNYERFYPIYDEHVFKDALVNNNTYVNPPAMVQVISGSAGCQELPGKPKNPHPWSVFANREYGYGRLHIANSTHVYWEQVSDEKNGAIVDWMWLRQDNHGPFPTPTSQ